MSIICIGGSSGSIGVLHDILGNLPCSFDMPIAVVLHRHITSQDTLMRLLRSRGMPAIVEPFDKDALSNGAVYLAPPDYHMMIDGDAISLSTDLPEHHARPSIDFMFDSAADTFGRHALGVILSGASGDGALGAHRIHHRGGHVIVQNPATAEAPAMPLATLNLTPTAQVLDASEISDLLRHILNPEGSGDE